MIGTELDKISDEELSELLPKISVYARVSPEHKIRIVDLWQKKGQIVAMTCFEKGGYWYCYGYYRYSSIKRCLIHDSNR